jgi:hypothetical protein
VRPLLLTLIAVSSAIAQSTVELDNPYVHVTRIKLAPHEKLPARAYPASVRICLSDAPPLCANGATAWRPTATSRAEENTSAQPLEEVLIELKAPHPPSPLITLDPVKLDPKYHTVDFENDRVRVLRTVLEPHINSPMHQHLPYVVVYITELHTTMALADGKLVDNVRKRGEIAWRDAMKHSTENIGTHTAMEIQVELK